MSNTCTIPDNVSFLAVSMFVCLVAYIIFWFVAIVVEITCGKYDAGKFKRRITGLENKLFQYAPAVNWKTFVTDEEKREDSADA